MFRLAWAASQHKVIAMAFRASHQFARISARKVRPLADLIRGKFADEALDILKYQPQRGARMLEKVLQSALGNAQDPDQNPGKTVRTDDLIVKDARVDGGPMFKRIKPVSRGMAYMIQRKTSHISIVLEDVNEA
jgi:large subunit ribosomal protein L22